MLLLLSRSDAAAAAAGYMTLMLQLAGGKEVPLPPLSGKDDTVT
jgi:hypothetical protein